MFYCQLWKSRNTWDYFCTVDHLCFKHFSKLRIIIMNFFFFCNETLMLICCNIYDYVV